MLGKRLKMFCVLVCVSRVFMSETKDTVNVFYKLINSLPQKLLSNQNFASYYL